MIALAVGLALLSTASESVDAQGRARQFLEAFAADPVKAKQFATKDANIVGGDIGGPYDEFAKVVRSEGSWLKTCQVGSLSEKPGPSVDELKDAPPRYQGGAISIVEGNYICSHADGSKFDVKVSVVLKNDQVMELYLGEGPK